MLGVEIEPDLVALRRATTWPRPVSRGRRSRRASPGVLGLPDHAPYDRILVSAEPARRCPEELVDQLGDGGRMVIPVDGTMLLVTRHGDDGRGHPARRLPVRAAALI